MSTKRIIFAVLCALLALVLIMTVVTAVKLVQMFNGPEPTEPTGTQPSVSESTASSTSPSTAPSTEATTPPTTLPTVPPTTQPTSPSTNDHTHNFNIVLNSQAPTCTDGGYKELQCSCGETYWEVLDKLEHSYGYGETIPVSCTTDGCTRYTCTACGYVDERNVAQATGHAYDNGTFHKATCTEDAYTLYTCANANCPEKTKTEVLENSKTGHTFGAWIEKNGVLTQACGNCDTSYTSDELEIKYRFLDGPNNSYRVYELDVGTEENPVVYRYKITDFINNNTLEFRYAYSTGLTINYIDDFGDPHEVILSAMGGQHTIEEVTAPDSEPSDPSDPSDPSEPSDPSDPDEVPNE